jgi:hypothetical protein
MRKICSVLFLSFFAVTAFTQTAEENIALDLVRNNSAALGLNANDIDNSTISSTYVIDGTNIRMVYLQQTYKGLPVFNKIQTLAFKDGKPVSAAGERVADMERVAVPESGVPVSTPQMAVQSAFTESNISTVQSIIPVSVFDNGRRLDFGQLGVSNVNIIVKLLWTPDEIGKVQLAWQVELAPKNTSDHWLIRINANNNTVLGKNNYTVYCNWKESENAMACNDEKHQHAGQQTPQAFNQEQQPQQPFIINGATYKIIPYPAESPIHPGGTPANRTDPWLLSPAGSNATTLKWHSNGTTDYTFTRGNNVWAYEDRDANNIAGAADTSTTADPLTFTKTYDFAQEPIVNINQRSATTNLFYWNNLIHDIFYLYGFNEVAGNFQVNNQGRGGLGNDAVLAEAQDGGGSNNANFNTPVDGGAGRMQMYLWTAPTPDRDGDLDNGIIIHEYGHGISNRFTGGPGNSSCLGNQEQMGEGWSDYFGLMLTHNWATATLTDGFNNPRGIGTYALNQPITGVGIRQYPYTTNMAVNPFTYSNITTVAVPHGIGSVWCTILWDMTWDMIQLDGINPNLFNVAGTGGNSAALKLVTEGMRLQPCSPGFVDGRNAILRADTLFFGARYSCIIWKAFARRGLGVNASQGLSASRTDQVVDFTEKSFDFTFTQNVTQQSEGQNIIYTATTKSICLPLTNYKVVDTLPLNVTHVSGGTYNAGNRTVTFSGINLASGASQANSFTVRVNPGSYFPPITHINEPVAGATIPASWTATSTTSITWKVSNAQSISAPNSFFTRDTTIASDQILTTTGSYAINGITTLSFQHLHNTENTYDGGVVEVSTNNGASWADLGNYFTANGYNATLIANSGPLVGRRAFTGNSTTFKLSVIDLSSFKGQTIKIRFRFGSDIGVGTTTGWYIDNITMATEASVFTTAKLFDGANVLKSTKDLITKITPNIVPLRLIAFGGYLENSDAKLQWITENEVNINRFEVERSFNGANFAPIHQIAANNGTQRSNYNAMDMNLLNQSSFAGVVYYRLKIIDRNGVTSYSNIIRMNSGKGGLLTILPNPAKNKLDLGGFTDNRKYEMSISDMTGKTVITGSVSSIQNSINISALEKGVYVLQLKNNETREVYRFVKD